MIQNNTSQSIETQVQNIFELIFKRIIKIKTGTIKKVNGKFVTVEVDFKPYVDVEQPLIQDVPYIVLGGVKNYLKIPINIGDKCVLLFADRSLDNIIGGGVAENTEINSINNAVAIIGWSVDNAVTDKLELNSEHDILLNSEQKIDIKSKQDLTVSSDAKYTLTSKSDLSVSSDSKLSLTSKSDFSLQSDAKVDIIAKGDVTVSVNGKAHLFKADGSIMFASGASVTPAGDVITKNGISLDNHIHGDPISGVTDKPLPADATPPQPNPAEIPPHNHPAGTLVANTNTGAITGSTGNN